MRRSLPTGMRGIAVSLVAVAAFAIVLVLHHAPRTLQVGKPVPALELTDLHGNAVNLASLPTERTAVYNVFTTWCPACNNELPAIKQTANLLARRGINVVGIDQGESAGQVQRFRRSAGLNYPLLLDERRLSTGRLGARIIPETFIVRDGVVSQIIVGPTTTAAVLAAVGER